MSILKTMHRRLTTNPRTRRLHRRLHRGLKSLVNVPDAYGELFEIIDHQQPVVLDVGAFIGETVVRFLDDTDAHVHAFEPTPSSAAALRDRFDGNAQVTVHELALSNEIGESRLFMNANAQTNSLLPSSGYPQDDGLDRAMQSVSSETIWTTTLDEWIKQEGIQSPLLIKADVQGAEGRLVDGGRRTFERQVIGFYSEAQIAPMYDSQIDFVELHRKLTQECGLALREIFPCMRDRNGLAVQVDALWVRP